MLTGAPVFGLIFDFPSTNGSVIIHFAFKATLCLTATTINYENNIVKLYERYDSHDLPRHHFSLQCRHNIK